MIEQDTIELLRECDAGIKMGVAAIDEVLDNAQDEALRKLLSKCKSEHEQLKKSILSALERSRRGQESQSHGQDHVHRQNQHGDDDEAHGRNHRRPDHRRLQHGREVALQISQPIRRRGRERQGLLQKADCPGRAAGEGSAGISVRTGNDGDAGLPPRPARGQRPRTPSSLREE